MMSLGKKVVMAAVGVGAMLLTTGTSGYANATPDSLPPGTIVTATGTLHLAPCTLPRASTEYISRPNARTSRPVGRSPFTISSLCLRLSSPVALTA
jgi:hypothetical protein